MGEAPAFQFYARDFLVSTTRMTTAQVGLYMRALSNQWDSGPLPVDEEELARTLISPIAEFRKLWPVVSRKFVLTDAGYVNNRLEKERKKQEEYRAKRAANGAKGGRPRKPTENLEVIARFSEEEPNENLGKALPSALCDLQSATAVKTKTPRAKRADPVPCEGFDEFWLAYPLKVQKLDAIRAWNALAPTPAQREFIGAALIWQRPSLTFEKDGQIKGTFPATWLNGRRWEDERPAAPVASKPLHSVADVRYLARQLGPGSWASECMRLHGGTCGDPQTHEQRSAVAS